MVWGTAFIAIVTLSPIMSSCSRSSGVHMVSTHVRSHDQPTGRLVVRTAPWGQDPTGVHSVTFGGPSYQLKLALAGGGVSGAPQTTSSLCQETVGCVAAMNGDFFANGESIGGIVKNCVLLETPQIPHELAELDSRSFATGLNWSVTVSTASGISMNLSGVNQSVLVDGPILYTPNFQGDTPGQPGREDLIFNTPSGQPASRLGKHTEIILMQSVPGGVIPVEPNEAVISVASDSPLASLAIGSKAELLTHVSGGCNAIGGHPIILSDGQPVAPDPNDTAMLEQDARSVLGWLANGTGVLLTVDSNAQSPGATIPELATYLKTLGVVDAINMDGGGSSALVANGHLLNAPKDGQERPVETALVVVKVAR